MAKKKKTTVKEYQNKKAFHDYTIEDIFEVGIMLKGSEVKAIRDGRLNLKDSFVRIVKDEIFLFNAHISCLNTTNSAFRHEEDGSRKLLLHKKQIIKLQGKVAKDGYTIVATKGYFSAKNIFKLNIGIAKGKKNYDKRADLKAKTLKLEASQAMKNYR